MIDWQTIRTVAKSLVEDLSGVTVRWQDEAEGTVWDNAPIIYLRVSALVGVGIPEEQYKDAVPDDMLVNVAAQKRFTLSLRAESFDQNLADGQHAGAILETLKTRLKRTTTIERLRNIFCIQESLNSSWFNYTNQGRQVSAYTLDLLCATVDNDTEDTAGAGGYIDEVMVQSNSVRNIDGTPTATQVNLDIKP